jgi:pimeloyl-ACP methyl ester carboxylesterase
LISTSAPLRGAQYPTAGQVIPDLVNDEVPNQVAQLAAAAEERTTSCGQGQMVWRLWGEGPAVVLFHGAFGSWTHWLKSISVLSRQYRVIVPDIPGFGDSDLPPEPYSTDSMADILSEGLKEILSSGETIAFVGFSFGGQMAARCARNLKDRARQIILVGSSNLGVARGTRAPALSWRRLTTRLERDAVHRRNLEIVMFHDPSKIDDLAVWLQRNNAERSQLRDLPRQESLREPLSEAGRRIAFVCGGEDPRCKPCLEIIEEALRTISVDPSFVVLRGQGHWLSYEAPDLLNPVLLALLDPDASASAKRGLRAVIP